MVTAIDTGGVEGTLDAVESLWVSTVVAQCEMFELAAHYADLCDGEAVERSGRVLPGMERSVRLGGVGTPRVAEFAVAELGARMRMGSVAARHYLADALDARHRLPRLWARVLAREVRVGWVRLVASRTRELSPEAAGRVDAEMAQSADGRISWSRFCARLEGRVVAADAEAAARREEAAELEQFARATRSCEAGMKGFYLRGPAALVVRFDATVAYLAQALAALGDTDGEDLRRVKACAIMANPTQAVELLAAFAAHRSRLAPEDRDADRPDDLDEPLHDEPLPEVATAPVTMPRPFRPATLPAWLARAVDPQVGFRLHWPRLLPRLQVYLHLAEESIQRTATDAADGGGVVRWRGEGPVTVEHVRQRLAPYHDVTVTPVLDLAGQEPVDAYEIPERHRRAVRLRTPADCFPFAANLDPVDLDHTEAYRHARDGEQVEPGQSRMDNYSPLGRLHHRIKTFGRWQVRQPFDGIYLWRDPHGQHYLVDHTGTRKVSPSACAVERARPSRAEVYISELILEYVA